MSQHPSGKDSTIKREPTTGLSPSCCSTNIWLLARQFKFDRNQLAEAIVRTFRTRETALPDEIVAFSDAFVNAKATQWNAFRRKLKQDTVPAEFGEIVHTIRTFLDPVIETIRNKLAAQFKDLEQGAN